MPWERSVGIVPLECRSSQRGHPKPAEALLPAARSGRPPCSTSPRKRLTRKIWLLLPLLSSTGWARIVAWSSTEEGRGLAAKNAVRWSDAREPIVGHDSYLQGGQADPSAAFRQLPGSGKGVSPPPLARPRLSGSPSFLRCRCVQPGAPLPAAGCSAAALWSKLTCGLWLAELWRSAGLWFDRLMRWCACWAALAADT